MILHSGGYILVEGQSDKLFVDRILLPEILARRPGLYVKSVEHAEKSSKLVRGIVGTATKSGKHYVFLCDLDNCSCYGLKRTESTNKYPCLDRTRIVVVNREIESWYLAGLDSTCCHDLGIPFIPRTDGITKERFAEMRPSRLRTNLDFMLEILDLYDLQHALSEARSGSLAYFCANHCNLSLAS